MSETLKAAVTFIEQGRILAGIYCHLQPQLLFSLTARILNYREINIQSIFNLLGM